jgi:hypothetical protein
MKVGFIRNDMDITMDVIFYELDYIPRKGEYVNLETDFNDCPEKKYKGRVSDVSYRIFENRDKMETLICVYLEK